MSFNSEMPIFTKTFDFLNWLVPASNNFPKLHRHTITRRLLDAALDFQETILKANALRGQRRLALLQEADGHLDVVRIYLRLVHEWRWLTMGQYEHAARMTTEIGRLLGAWQKVTK